MNWLNHRSERIESGKNGIRSYLTKLFFAVFLSSTVTTHKCEKMFLDEHIRFTRLKEDNSFVHGNIHLGFVHVTNVEYCWLSDVMLRGFRIKLQKRGKEKEEL